MEVIDDFFPKVELAYLRRSFPLFEEFHISELDDNQKHLMKMVSPELSDLPDVADEIEMVQLHSGPLLGVMAIYSNTDSRNVLIGKKRYVIKPNRLAILEKPATVPNEKTYIDEDEKKKKILQSGMVLLFSCRNPKNGYRKNLLAEFGERGISQILFEIFSYLSFQELKTLYHNNPVAFKSVISSPNARKFWSSYWLENYGTHVPEEPLKIMTKVECELKDLGLEKDQLKILAKYNVDKQFKKLYGEYTKEMGNFPYNFLQDATEYDSLEVLKVLVEFLGDFDEFKSIIVQNFVRAEIGPRCLGYLSTLINPDNKNTFIGQHFRLSWQRGNVKYIQYYLQTYSWDTGSDDLNEALNYLKNGEIEKFSENIIESDLIHRQKKWYIKIENGERKIDLLDMLIPTVTEENYPYLRTVFRERNLGVRNEELNLNLGLAEYLLNDGMYPETNVEPLDLSPKALDILRRNGYSIVVNLYLDKKEMGDHDVYRQYSHAIIDKDEDYYLPACLRVNTRGSRCRFRCCSRQRSTQGGGVALHHGLTEDEDLAAIVGVGGIVHVTLRRGHAVAGLIDDVDAG